MSDRRPSSSLDRISGLTALFFVVGALFFGLGVAERVLLFVTGFSQILLVLFLAWLLAFLLGPLVEAFDRRLPGPKALAMILVYLALSGAVALFIFAIATIGVAEIADLLARSDEMSARILGTLRDWQSGLAIDPATFDLVRTFERFQRSVGPDLGATISQSAETIATTTVAILGNAFLVIILSLYAVADAPSILATLARVVPNRYEAELLLVQRSVGQAFSGFLRTQVVLMAIQVGLTVLVGILFGLPYLFLVCVAVGLAMLVPFFGPPLALVPPILVAFGFRPEVIVPVLLILIVGQTIVVNVMQPRLMRQSVGIHPIMVIVALLVGAQVAGLWGAIFGIPVVAVLSMLARYIIDLRTIAEVPEIDGPANVAAIQASDPSVHLEQAVAIVAEAAEASRESNPVVSAP